MASTFPGALDNFTDPVSNSPLNSPSHSAQHADLNDAVEKIETYMGLVKVIPTSATNGTVGATGTVTIGSAVSSVTVSGAFSSLYNNYLIVVSGGASVADTNMSMVLGSKVTNYKTQLIYATFNNTLAAIGTTTNVDMPYCGNASTTGLSCVINVNNPFTSTKNTFVNAQWNSSTNAGTFIANTADTISYTAFTLTSGGTTMTGGTITVYGYRI